MSAAPDRFQASSHRSQQGEGVPMSMTDRDTTLPPGFDDLEPLVATWALSTEQTRYTKRVATPMHEVRAFYDAIYPCMDAVMRHLQDHPADDMASLPAPTRRLYRLALSYFEVSHPIELHWRSANLDNAFPAERIEYQGPSCVEN